MIDFLKYLIEQHPIWLFVFLLFAAFLVVAVDNIFVNATNAWSERGQRPKAEK